MLVGSRVMARMLRQAHRCVLPLLVVTAGLSVAACDVSVDQAGEGAEVSLLGDS